MEIKKMLHEGGTYLLKNSKEMMKPKILAPLVCGVLGFTAGAVQNTVYAHQQKLNHEKKVQIEKKRKSYLHRENLKHSYEVQTILGREIKADESVFSAGDTLMDHLTAQESYLLGKKIFGNGQGIELLVALDTLLHGQGNLVSRFVALGIHEGRLTFQIRNDDPAVLEGAADYHGKTTSNMGTFQQYDPSNVENKYKKNLEFGLEIYEGVVGKKPNLSQLTTADMDVIGHIGYIVSEREYMYEGKTTILEALTHKDIPEKELGTLIRHFIQGGVPAIGDGVLTMLKQGYQVEWNEGSKTWVRVSKLVNKAKLVG